MSGADQVGLSTRSITSAQRRCIHSCRLFRNTVVWKSWVVISPVMPGASSKKTLSP